MGDLISRSDLYNRLVELETLARNRVLDTPTNSPCYQRYVSQMNERTMFKGLVADMRTAYDVDKVIEDLSSNSRFIDDINEHNIKCISCVIGQKTAIDIVKAGGAE